MICLCCLSNVRNYQRSGKGDVLCDYCLNEGRARFTSSGDVVLLRRKPRKLPKMSFHDIVLDVFHSSSSEFD